VRNLIIGVLSRVGPVNVAATPATHADPSPPRGSASDASDSTTERRSPGRGGEGADLTTPAADLRTLDRAGCRCRPSRSPIGSAHRSPSIRCRRETAAATATGLVMPLLQHALAPRPRPGRWLAGQLAHAGGGDEQQFPGVERRTCQPTRAVRRGPDQRPAVGCARPRPGGTPPAGRGTRRTAVPTTGRFRKCRDACS
jgi:hypothetical protein